MCPGGPADGRLVPGDQLVKINNIAVDDLTPEQAAEIIRSTLTAAHTHTCMHDHRYIHHKDLFKIKLLYAHHNVNSHSLLFFQGVPRFIDNDCPQNDAGESNSN